VDRIPTITATIAINAIGYAVEVNAVLLCDSVSVGGIICLNEHQRSANEMAERIVLSEFKVAHNFSFS